jgi:uncharacterized protein YkwD
MQSESSPGSRRAVLFIVPLAVLTVLGLVFGRSLLGSSPQTALAVSPVNRTPVAASSTGTSGATTDEPETKAAPKLKDLGVVKGTLTLKGPASASKDAFVVFVVAGPKRVVKTDTTAPFSAKVNTKVLPNGTYTVTTLVTLQGDTSVASTSTAVIKNAKPKSTPSMTAYTSASGSGSGPVSGSTVSTNTGYTAQVLALTNSERAKAGCKALSVSSKLTKAAQSHSTDMAAKNYFSHDSQDGRSPFDRMKDAGYSFSAAAENIAMGQQTPADVMTAWMNSAGHKANILNCTYTQLGVGYAVSKSGSSYWTQDFGKPL